MNKRTFLPLIIASVSTFSGVCSVLTPDEALSRVGDKTLGLPTRSGQSEMILDYTLYTDANQPALYVFNREENNGYIILSADDSAAPLLGYSDSGKFDASKIPPQLSYFLQEYGNRIQLAREQGAEKYTVTTRAGLPDLAPIAPLLKSKWNQGDPFNLYCYTIAADGTQTKSVTGCVATAMAQVMYYFKYPEIGHGEISYTHADSGTYSMNFGQQPFEWNDMLPTYYPESYTEDQADAVAYLMKACGYSVKMNYGKGESGADGANIGSALINYFGYNDNIVIRTRKFFTYSQWTQMIYENLSKAGPVVYDGSALDGGHSFVCDGYDGNGYFHFNWGWGGMSDGYYLLDALNPDEFGIGGTAGGYNLGQQIILGISSKDIDLFPHYVMQYGSVAGKIDKSSLSLELTGDGAHGFQYIDPLQINVTFGVAVTNITNPTQTVQYVETSQKNLEASEGTMFHWSEVGKSINLDALNLTVGDSYDISISTLISSGSNSEWENVVAMPGLSNKVTVVKTANGYEITNYNPGSIGVSDFEVENATIYQNLPVKFSATFSNESDQALTRNYSAVFFDSKGTEVFKMENYSVNVDANETLDQVWTSVEWYKENGATDITEATTYTLKLYDNWMGEYVDGIQQTVTVLPEPKDTKVDAVLSVEGALKEGNVFVVDSNQFEASITVKVIEGYFNSTINLGIEVPLSDGKYYTLMHRHFDAIPELSAGDEQTWTMSMSVDDVEPGKIYRLQAWSQGGNLGDPIEIKFNIENDAVDSINAESGPYEVYSLSGLKVMTTSDASIIRSLPNGIYIINGEKTAIFH